MAAGDGEEARDARLFTRRIQELGESPHDALRGFFAPEAPIVIARAPGRLDVMGGIADYSGSLVLQLPIAPAALAAAQRADDAVVRIASLAADPESRPRTFAAASAELEELAGREYDDVRQWFRDRSSAEWAAYIAGVIVVLVRGRRASLGKGLRLLIQSSVPEGKGVSSSAAIEVAAMQAVANLLGARLGGEDLARLCQLAENHIVGAPCGIMDQMTAAFGRANQLLALRCQPAEMQGFASVPASISFWGIDSGVRHAVSGADYVSVRTGAFMGYRIMAELAGLEASAPDGDGVVTVRDPRWRGYLANVPREEFTERFADRLPDKLSGGEFLARYGGITDSVTRVDPQRTYAVRQPTAHPIHEHQRVRRFASLLSSKLDDDALSEMGELMVGSHESYSACGLGAHGTDQLVGLVREAGPQAGLYGAKITGGGSGGTVAILGRADAADAVAAIAGRYRRQTGLGGTVFANSSMGACAFGLLQMTIEPQKRKSARR